MFDPYRKWLGIPEGQRPPTHYQLLGIAPDEHDRDVINAAVDLWTTTITASAQDDPKVGQRSTVYAELGRKLQSAVLPFFIPKDKNLIALPAVIHP